MFSITNIFILPIAIRAAPFSGWLQNFVYNHFSILTLIQCCQIMQNCNHQFPKNVKAGNVNFSLAVVHFVKSIFKPKTSAIDCKVSNPILKVPFSIRVIACCFVPIFSANSACDILASFRSCAIRCPMRMR